MSKGRVKPSLNTLSRESFGMAEFFDEFRHELLGPSDRACALLGAAYLERNLIFLVQAKMRAFTKKESDALFFDERAILKTFSARAEIAYALEIISKEEKTTLDSVRRVRNVFAHPIRPVTFEHELIAAVCKTLPYSRTATLDVPLGPHRRIYVHCIQHMISRFSVLFIKAERKKEIIKLVTDPYAQENIAL
jgi:hypothetical protein